MHWSWIVLGVAVILFLYLLVFCMITVAKRADQRWSEMMRELEVPDDE